MGEISDQIIDQMFDTWFDDHESPELYGFRSRGARRKRSNFQNEKGIWRDKYDNRINIKDMSDTYIMNAIQFADKDKVRELENELEERKRLQATPNTPKLDRVDTK